MEEKLRTFIALKLGQEIRQMIETYINRFQKHNLSGFRWVKPENLHLTLKFLGDTPAAKVQTVNQALDTICAEVEPFDIQFEGTGAFPSWQRPRTIWIGMKTCVEIELFYLKLDKALGAIDIPSDGKRFSPHLTICRVSDFADTQIAQQLKKEMESFSISGVTPWKVSKVTFFKSKLQPGGPVYTPLSEHMFMKSRKM